MAKNGDYTNKLQDFANRVKSEPVQLPVQKLTPVVPSTSNKDEQQLNVWIPKDLLKRLKVKGIETNKSLKDMVIEALNQFV